MEGKTRKGGVLNDVLLKKKSRSSAVFGNKTDLFGNGLLGIFKMNLFPFYKYFTGINRVAPKIASITSVRPAPTSPEKPRISPA